MLSIVFTHFNSEVLSFDVDLPILGDLLSFYMQRNPSSNPYLQLNMTKLPQEYTKIMQCSMDVLVLTPTSNIFFMTIERGHSMLSMWGPVVIWFLIPIKFH